MEFKTADKDKKGKKKMKKQDQTRFFRRNRASIRNVGETRSHSREDLRDRNYSLFADTPIGQTDQFLFDQRSINVANMNKHASETTQRMPNQQKLIDLQNENLELKKEKTKLMTEITDVKAKLDAAEFHATTIREDLLTKIDKVDS